jgi:DNA-binding HxlR family transcriptional regulator
MVTRRSDQPRSGCAFNAAVEVIGDRWYLLVLRDVMFGNRRQFRRGCRVGRSIDQGTLDR